MYFILQLKKKKHSNWSFMKLAIFIYFVLELIICRFLYKFFYRYFV